MDAILELQAAARRVARHIAPGCYAARVVILDHNGRELLGMAVPPGEDATTATASTLIVQARQPEPPAAGWSFNHTRAFYDGKPLEIHGQKLKVLRAFVQSAEPLTVEALRKHAWEDVRTEEATVRWTVGELRKSLRAYFPDLEDPIPNGIDGYALQIR